MIGLTACGGETVNVGAVLNDAFHPAQRVRSGVLALSFGLSGSGSTGPLQPLALTVAGPFQSLGNGRIPRFALSLSNSAQGRTATITTISTGSRFFVEVAGVPFVAPANAFAVLQRSYVQAAARSPGTGSTPLTSLGIDPGAWLSAPRLVGTVRLDGVPTLHVRAGVVVPRFLADLDRVTGAGGELALAGSTAPSSSLSAAQLAALSRSIAHATVDVYVGAADHILRRLELRASIVAAPGTGAALGGLLHGALAFALGFSAINRPVTVAAPAHALPLATLISDLKQLGVGGHSAAASTPGGSQSAGAAGQSTQSSSTSSSSSSAASAGFSPSLNGAAPPAYLRCYAQAGPNLVARAKCAPLLNGG